MLRNHSNTVLPRVESSSLVVMGLLVFNLFFNVLANASFKIAAFSTTWRGFLAWQVIGNLAGFITVLTLTGLLRHMPLGVAFPVTTGLSIIGVQIMAARFYFHEPVSAVQWLGTLLIAMGIFLVYA